MHSWGFSVITTGKGSKMDDRWTSQDGRLERYRYCERREPVPSVLLGTDPALTVVPAVWTLSTLSSLLIHSINNRRRICLTDPSGEFPVTTEEL
jgi:hypothetical protein